MSTGSRIAVRLRLAVVAASLAATLLAAVHVHAHAAPSAAADACALCRVAHAPVLLAAPPALPSPVAHIRPDQPGSPRPAAAFLPSPVARGPPAIA